MNLVALGNVCIDKNKIEKSLYKSAGGPPKFMSLFFSKVKDASFGIIASYGADFLPYKKGLNLYPLRPNASNTLVYENIIKNRKRTQKCHFYKEALPPVIDKNITNIIRKSDVLFITPLIPHFPVEYIKKAVKIVGKNCLKMLLPQGYFRQFDANGNVLFREFKEAEVILPLVDIVILSDQDYPNIEKLALEWSNKYGTTFIITKAHKGATVINKNRRSIIKVKPIPAKQIFDSIGAGDVFAAAFGYYYFKNKDLLKSVKLANQAAREKLILNATILSQ